MTSCRPGVDFPIRLGRAAPPPAYGGCRVVTSGSGRRSLCCHAVCAVDWSPSNPLSLSPAAAEPIVVIEAAGPQPREADASVSFLEAVLAAGVATDRRDHESAARVDRFLSAADAAEALDAYAGGRPQTPEQLQRLRMRLACDAADLDDLIARQVNELLHHPQFQALEANWRGLALLVDAKERHTEDVFGTASGAGVVIRVLSVEKQDLVDDFRRGLDETDNTLFRLVYDEEFGMPGGKPYGTLLSTHQFRDHPQDLDLLSKMAAVGEAALCPVIAGAEPGLLGLDSFTELGRKVDIQQIFDDRRRGGWKRLRAKPSSQFLGLTLPRVVLRRPYHDDGSTRFGLRFEEDVRGRPENYLWGSAAFAFGTVLIRTFARTGWFADIRGAERGGDGGGLVTDLPVLQAGTDSPGVCVRPTVEVALGDVQEATLCENGLLPVSDCKDTPYSVFYSNQSVHQPSGYTDADATNNARMAAMLQYVLCAARVGHCAKVMVRDRVGGFTTASELEDDLRNWLVGYISGDNVTAQAKTEFPLAEAKAEITERLDSPGHFDARLFLRPHYQLDRLASAVSLTVRDLTLSKG